MIEQFKRLYEKLPEQKTRLDFFIAILTIPVLLTVIISNVLNIKSKEQQSGPTPTLAPISVITNTAPAKSSPEFTTAPASPSPQATNTPPSPTPNPECIKDIGPVEIINPKENQLVSDDPVCIDINYSQGNYCSVVWSYRINGGKWSDYGSNNPCFSALQGGDTSFELKVKSVAVSKEITLERNFRVAGNSASPSPSSSPSPTVSTSVTPEI